MSAPQQFSLKWNNYSQHIVTAFEDLRGEDDFTDVTLSCEGKRIKAHKVLLSACSAYFKETFRENPCKHPVIILKNVDFQDLQAVVTFMYNGQVNISQERLSTFLQTAELLQIKGLTESQSQTETPSSKKRSHASATTEPVTNVSQKASDDLITPEITVPRPPTPKRKRIGPASFMNQQQNQSQSDSHQVPITTQAGSFHSNVVGGGIRQTSLNDTSSDTMNAAIAGPSGVSSSTGGFINPETVIIPSSNMIDPSATHLSSSNESYSHGIIKFEEEDLIDEDDDYDKTNMSEDNDNSLHDMLGNVEHEPNSMGSYMAGPSGQGIKIVSVGSDSTSHGIEDGDKMTSELNIHRPPCEWSPIGSTLQSTQFEIPKIFSGLELSPSPIIPNEQAFSFKRNLMSNDYLGGGGTTTTSSTSMSTMEVEKSNPNNPAATSFSSMFGQARKKSVDQIPGLIGLPGTSSSPNSSNDHRCNICSKTFTLRTNLVAHLRSHDNATICPYCNKKLSTIGNLKSHILAVHDAVPIPARRTYIKSSFYSKKNRHEKSKPQYRHLEGFISEQITIEVTPQTSL